MRAHAQPQPLLVPPINEVVPALASRTRPVRDLVVPIARGGENALGGAIEAGDAVVVGLRRGGAFAPAPDTLPTRPGPIRDGLLGLERKLERVTRHVVRAERDRGLEVGAPGLRGLPGPAEDEVEVYLETERADRVDGGRGVPWLMRPPERPQPVGGE